MGRRERALDIDAGPTQRFAGELRELRQRAGSPTYRTMAAQAGYSAPALSQAAAGERGAADRAGHVLLEHRQHAGHHQQLLVRASHLRAGQRRDLGHEPGRRSGAVAPPAVGA